MRAPSYHKLRIKAKLYIKTAAFVFLVGGYTIYNLARDSLKATEGLLANPNSRILTETPEAFCPVKAADPTYMVVVYFFGVIYLFIGLAVIADDFFCPALDILADDLHLSQDVAGATLMAAGGSAPELFANLIGTFIRSDVGFGTIVGSAVFNVLFVVGFCSLVTDTPMKLTAWPLLRDSSFYSLTLCILALFFGVFSPQKIELFEAVILFALYWLYVFIMYHNVSLRLFFESQFNGDKNTPLSLRNQGNGNQYNLEIESEQLSSKLDGQQGIKDSSLFITIDSSSRSSRMETPTKEEGSCSKFKTDRFSSFSKKYRNYSDYTSPLKTPTEEIVEEEEGGLSMDFPIPGSGYFAWFWYIITFPLFGLFVYTIVDVKKRNDLAILSFTACLAWMGLLSYYLVNWVEIIGATLGIPSVIMGLTFLAAGTSIPDMLAAVIVAKKGYGDQAVSSSIGSNVFDITVGLAFPWLLFNLIYSIPVVVIAEGFLVSIIILFLTLIVMILTIQYRGWELPKTTGYFFIFLYFVYVVQQVARSPYGVC